MERTKFEVWTAGITRSMKAAFDLFAGEPCYPIIVLKKHKYAGAAPKSAPKNATGERRALPLRAQDTSSEEDVNDESYDEEPQHFDHVDDSTFMWNFIAKCNWRNRSDGRADTREAQGIANAMDPVNRRRFSAEYQSVFNTISAVVIADGLVDRTPEVTVETVASHLIGLGRDTYANMITDMEIVQFLAESGDCINFSEALSAMKMI